MLTARRVRIGAARETRKLDWQDETQATSQSPQRRDYTSLRHTQEQAGSLAAIMRGRGHRRRADIDPTVQEGKPWHYKHIALRELLLKVCRPSPLSWSISTTLSIIDAIQT